MPLLTMLSFSWTSAALFLLLGGGFAAAPLVACAPHEVPRATTWSPPDLEASDPFGVGLLLDEASALGDEGSDERAMTYPDAPPVDEGAANGAAVDGPSLDTVNAPGPPFDSGPGGVCLPPLAAGDLVIDELMIQSVAGTGDYGEWLEVRSTRDCALDLRGLHGEAPSGAKVRAFDIVDDSWLAAHGTFVVADSINQALNHDLPGTVVAWGGRSGDVLRNKGGTVTLRINDALIDSVTYPAIAQTIGASLSFPSDCAESRRSDWTVWQFSTSPWFPGFEGTPNAPNTDVQCP